MTGQSTFITNQTEKKLKDRLVKLILKSKELKFLVGFFYFSGITELYETLRDNPGVQLEVLVGLNVDRNVFGLIEYADNTKQLTDRQRFERLLDSISKSINSDDFDNEMFYQQVNFFIDLIKQDRLRIRKTYEPNHSKLYIFRLKDEYKDIKEAFFITGSSNLTRAGLSEQNEFNVEISDYGVKEAEDYFDLLWKKAVKVTEVAEYKSKLIELIKYKSLVAEVTPFEAFALVIKIYLDVQSQKQVKGNLRDLLIKKGYMPYKYQLDAVSQALTIIDSYGGVIVADVVGLGKSIIAGMIARSLGKRGIIICPPAIIGDDNKQSGWMKYREDFGLYDWEIRSCGMENLTKTSEFIRENDEFEVVIIDEAHRFRNEDTEAYNILSNICRDKIVILLTATPFNNTPADIFSLLKLFIIPGKSRITLDDDLYSKFRTYNSTFKKLSNIKKNHNSTDKQKRDRALADYQSLFESDVIDLKKVKERAKYLSVSIRQVIEPVLVRRNRIDLKKDPEYSKEVYDLPDVKDPIEVFFTLTEEQSVFYDKVIHTYFGDGGTFTGAIYQPFIYETGLKKDDESLTEEKNREALIQSNLYDFMRRLLVKRFESSFGAFEQSIKNFQSITIKVQQFIDKTGRFILDRDLLEKIYDADIEDIEDELQKFQERLALGNYPKSYKVYQITTFKSKDKFLKDIQSDIKLFDSILLEISSLHLVDKDPKLDCLIDEVSTILEKKADHEPHRKVAIFTEYVDTAKYLENSLSKKFAGSLVTVAGNLNSSKAREILENFDASYKKQKDQYQVLLTTDKLSEGVNLNRAGAVINYDIPWNPTRVIQRVGRINRIGNKVFDELYIYNFFPTVQGAEYVQSRKIAADKMFLIHNTLGEDAKIFEQDEEPTAANLFKKIMQNPEKLEEETFQTKMRSLYFSIEKNHPEVINRIVELPPRVKTAKQFNQHDIVVFIRKGLGFFARGMVNNADTVADLIFENTIPMIECGKDEKMLPLSDHFWEGYYRIKDIKDKKKLPPGVVSLESRALNNIKTLLDKPLPDMDEYLSFLQDLREDIIEYKTLSEYALRTIANLKTPARNVQETLQIKDALDQFRNDLGVNYLSKIKQKLDGHLIPEVIIAIENRQGQV